MKLKLFDFLDAILHLHLFELFVSKLHYVSSDKCFNLFLSMFVLPELIFEKFQWSEIELAFNTNTTEYFTLRNFYSSEKF